MSSLEDDPYDWKRGTRYVGRYSTYDLMQYRTDVEKRAYFAEKSRTSLWNEKLQVEIRNAYESTNPIEVIRNGHSLPVDKQRVSKAIRERDNFVKADIERKRLDAATAELNRLCNDVHTLRVEKIIEYKRLIAIEEQKEIDAKIAS